MSNMSNYIPYLLILLLILIFLDNFNYLVSGQFLDIAHQNSIILNDKLYFFGGKSYKTRKIIHQIIYVDLSTSFSLLDQQRLLIKQIDPNSVIPPFHKASLALAGTNNGTLYAIAGLRADNPNTTDYGSIVYSTNTTLFDKWTPEVLDGQSELIDIYDTIYTQDNYGNIYIASHKHNPIYKFNTNHLTFTALKSDRVPNIDPYHFNCHLLDDETMIFFGLDMTKVYLFNIKQNLWSNVTTVGDKPSERYGHSSVSLLDGRIVVYGGTNGPDKLAILDTAQSPFKWTIPTNITYPIDEHHVGHSSNLYRNFMIIAFGWVYTDKLLVEPYSNILLLNIGDKNDYRWSDTFDFQTDTIETSTDVTPLDDYVPPKSNSYKGLIIILGSIAGVFVIALILLAIGMFRRNKKPNDNDDVNCGSSNDGERNSVLFSNINIDSEWLQLFENSVRIL